MKSITLNEICEKTKYKNELWNDKILGQLFYEFDFANDCSSDNYLKCKNLYEKYKAYKLTLRNKKFSNHDLEKMRADYKKTYEGIKDPDSGSELLQRVYKKLWDEEVICICSKNDRVYGDTMNSIQTTLNEYVWAKYEHKTQKPSIGNCVLNFETGLDEDDEEAISFFCKSHMVGNFIPVPADSFNAPRYKSTNDYWDLTLYYIYKWYKAVEKEKNGVDDIKEKIKQSCSCYIYGDNLCTLLGKDCQYVKKCIEWLCLFSKDDKPSWDEFVERNFLSMYVCRGKGHYGMPKLLWCNGVKNPMELEGKKLEEKWEERIKDIKKDNKKDNEEDNEEVIESCKNYFRNAEDCICERSKKIAEKLYEAYAKEVENEKN